MLSKDSRTLCTIPMNMHADANRQKIKKAILRDEIIGDYFYHFNLNFLNGKGMKIMSGRNICSKPMISTGKFPGEKIS